MNVSSINDIYNVIKNEYNTYGDNIFTNNTFINNMLHTYDINKVKYCFKTLHNISINYYINFHEHNVNEDDSNDSSYDSDNSEDSENEDNFTKTRARNDDEFKKLVRTRYNKCVICNESLSCITACYEITHILDFAKCENENDKYDINNGLLMCAHTHILFDKHLIKLTVQPFNEQVLLNVIHLNELSPIINIDTKNLNKLIIVSINIDSSLINSEYNKYNNKNILLYKKSLKYINKRYEIHNF